MPQGLPGADSCLPVTAELVQAATDLYGIAPAFWGRYFTSATTTGTVEYRHAKENGPLSAAGIKLLPIARQTARVNGTEQQGIEDGIANANDLITTFGSPLLAEQGGRFYMFLDVEGNPSLSSDYYTGWAQGLAQASGGHADVQILPCVYGPQGNTTTWKALAAASDDGAPCMGVWIARYSPNDCKFADWNDSIVTPAVPDPFPFRILAWQYSGNCLNGNIDCSQINPNIDAQRDLLDFLVLPPPATLT